MTSYDNTAYAAHASDVPDFKMTDMNSPPAPHATTHQATSNGGGTDYDVGVVKKGPNTKIVIIAVVVALIVVSAIVVGVTLGIVLSGSDVPFTLPTNTSYEEIDVGIVLVDLQFVDDMYDLTSQPARELTTEVINAIDSEYAEDEYYDRTTVLSLKPGSVHVTAEVAFIVPTAITPREDALEEIFGNLKPRIESALTSSLSTVVVVDINTPLCQYDPCKNGGTCSDRVGDYTCYCPKDFAGKSCEENVNNICGFRPASSDSLVSKRVVGGTPTSWGDWPWMVSLRDRYNVHRCGAVVVDDYVAVTAAYCVDQFETAVLGDLYLSVTSPYHVELEVKAVSHPDYNVSTITNDIAVISFRSALNFSTDYIRPLCLAREESISSYTKCYISGWGHTSEGGHLSDVLQEATVELIDGSACQALYPGRQITSEMICAGALSGEMDSCQGDTGGPLQCEDEEGRFHLVGVTSVGDGCGRPNYPGVYTRISAYLDFIKSDYRQEVQLEVEALVPVISPNFPSAYPTDIDHVWTIVALDGNTIDAYFVTVKIELIFDLLSVGYGDDSQDVSTMVDNSNWPMAHGYRIRDSRAWLRLQSGPTTAYQGFSVTFTTSVRQGTVSSCENEGCGTGNTCMDHVKGYSCICNMISEFCKNHFIGVRDVSASRTLYCDFEEDFCGWQQATYSGGDWQRSDGHVYLDTFGTTSSDSARLVSPPIIREGDGSDAPLCFTFFYRMNGEDIGDLNVYFIPEYTKIANQQWTRSGDIGDVWLLGEVDISQLGTGWVVIEGTSTGEPGGNIALDNVQLTDCIETDPPMGDISLSEGTVYLSSPQFPNAYPDSVTVSWTITAPTGGGARFDINICRLEPTFDVLTIGSGSDPSNALSVVQRFTGRLDNPAFLEILDQRSWIMFESDFSISDTGFLIAVSPMSFTENEVIPGEVLVILSPNFPHRYPNNMYIVWKLSAPAQHGLYLKFLTLATDPNDKVTIGSGESPSSSDSLVLAEFSGISTIIDDVVCNERQGWLMFNSDATGTANGFFVDVRAVERLDCSDEEAFRCPNGQCIHRRNICDNYNDCQDLSDETDCPFEYNDVDLRFDSSQTIRSPNYPFNYDDNARILWRVMAPPGYHATMSWRTFATELGYDYVTLFGGFTPYFEESLQISTFISGSLNPTVIGFESFATYMFIRFISDSSIQSQGFDLSVTLEEDTNETFHLTQSFPTQSISFETDLRKKLWRVTAPSGYSVAMHFTQFDGEHQSDFLHMYDAMEDVFWKSTKFFEHSGNELPTDVTSFGSFLWIVYTSTSLTSSRFSLDLEAVQTLDCNAEDVFECANKRCVPASATCDYINDCVDFSDENYCPPCSAVTGICMDILPYNLTFFPNHLLDSSSEAESILQNMETIESCHSSLMEVSCRMFIPECIHHGPTQRPCYSICVEVKDACEQDYNAAVSQPWPFNCTGLSDELEDGESCLGGGGDYLNTVCGTRPAYAPDHTRIVGGTKASGGEFPWMVSLRSASGTHFCGGSLIGTEWVMTAAHCVLISGQLISPLSIIVVLGDLFLTSQSAHHVTADVAEIIPYPSYDAPSHDGDIALLRLVVPVQFSDFVRPACLDEAPSTIRDHRRCFISGWGDMKTGHDADILLKAVVSLIDFETCQDLYTGELTDLMFCAGYERGGIDTCQGDSGGPLVCEGADGRWNLVGVTSWGYGCAQPGFPGIYAKVSEFANFITSTLGDEPVLPTSTSTTPEVPAITTSIPPETTVTTMPPASTCGDGSVICNAEVECPSGEDERECVFTLAEGESKRITAQSDRTVQSGYSSWTVDCGDASLALLVRIESLHLDEYDSLEFETVDADVNEHRSWLFEGDLTQDYSQAADKVFPSGSVLITSFSRYMNSFSMEIFTMRLEDLSECSQNERVFTTDEECDGFKNCGDAGDDEQDCAPMEAISLAVGDSASIQTPGYPEPLTPEYAVSMTWTIETTDNSRILISVDESMLEASDTITLGLGTDPSDDTTVVFTAVQVSSSYPIDSTMSDLSPSGNACWIRLQRASSSPNALLLSLNVRAVTAASLQCGADELQCGGVFPGCYDESSFCDGIQDCWDGADEECECLDLHSVRCGPRNRCLERQYFCDGTNQCGDNTDEMNCSFYCENGKVINPRFLCDGFNDCGDDSDEVGRDCECASNQFDCGERCIAQSDVCNGLVDCANEGDETDCTCMNFEIECSGGGCVPFWLLCDGRDDCGDNSDEDTETCRYCPGNYFQCDDFSACLAATDRCDGSPDCLDGSDEWGCGGGGPTTDAVPTASAPTEMPTGAPSVPYVPYEDCGMRPVVPGGEVTQPGEWPWHVFVYNNPVGRYCRGGIITEDWILTAAHCIVGGDGYAVKAGSLDHDQDQENVDGQTRSVSNAVIHPQYDEETGENDIALLKLSTPLTLSNEVQPLCLPDPGEVVPSTGSFVTAVGWIQTSGLPDRFEQVRSPVIPNDFCDGLTANRTIVPSMFCTLSRSADQSMCSNGSGGSIVQDIDGRWTFVGLSDPEMSCGGLYQPDTYTRINPFIDFIRSTLTEN